MEKTYCESPRQLKGAVPPMTMRGSMGAVLLRIQSQLVRKVPVRRVELPPGPQPGGQSLWVTRVGEGVEKGVPNQTSLLLIEVFLVCLPLYVCLQESKLILQTH